LLVIDPQNDFMHPEGAVACTATSTESLEQVLENINRLVEAARRNSIPIVWTKEMHRSDLADYGAEALSTEEVHTEEDSWGSDLVEGVERRERPGEYVVEKRRYNAFHATDLEHLLKTYGVDTVVLVGAATNVCVHYTAQGAHERDYVFRIVRGCTAGPSEELHEAGLELARYIQPDGVRSLEEVVSSFEEYGGNPVVEEAEETGAVTER